MCSSGGDRRRYSVGYNGCYVDCNDCRLGCGNRGIGYGDHCIRCSIDCGDCVGSAVAVDGVDTALLASRLSRSGVRGVAGGDVDVQVENVVLALLLVLECLVGQGLVYVAVKKRIVVLL